MEVCTQFKMDMSDPTLGPEQKCKNCQNAKKLHTAPQKPMPPMQKPPQQSKEQVKTPQIINPVHKNNNVPIDNKVNMEQVDNKQLKACDDFKLDMKDNAIGEAVKCLHCGIPKGQHNLQNLQKQKNPVELPKQPIKQPQIIITEQKPSQMPNNQLKQGETTNLIVQKQQQYEKEKEKDKEKEEDKACDNFQLNIADTQTGDAMRCKKCQQPKSNHTKQLKTATQSLANRLSSGQQGEKITQLINDAQKFDSKDPPNRKSHQPFQTNEQKAQLNQCDDQKQKTTFKQEPQIAPVRPSLGVQPPTVVKQPIPQKQKNDGFGQDDFKNLMKGVQEFNQQSNLKQIAEDADRKLNDEIRQPAKSMMPMMRIPGMGQPPPKKNPLEEKQSNETIDALVSRPIRQRRRTEQQDSDF